MRDRSIKDLAFEMLELARGVDARATSLDVDELDAAAHGAKRVIDIAQTIAEELEAQAMSLRFPPLDLE